MNETIYAGDSVRHRPTGEQWIVALVENDRLYWMGYPFGGSAELSDCILVNQATQEEREKALKILAESKGDELPIRRAKQRLEQMEVE